MFGGRHQRSFQLLERAAAACFILFCLLPVLAGLYLPHGLGLTKTPSAALASRVIILISTGGASFLIAMLPALLCVRLPVLWRMYTFLLFPVATICLITQVIMYREFGTEIDEHLLGLFQGNFSALWVFARDHYHIEWWITAMLAGAAALSWWIGRDSRFRWMPSPRLSFGAIVLFLVSGSLSLGVNPNIRDEVHYHPVKVAIAPLLQVLAFTCEQLGPNHRTGYEGILESAGEITQPGVRREIEKRLGEDIDSFCRHTVSAPGWLRHRPRHVFLFQLESIEYDLLVNPDLAGLTPRLSQFGREGLLVREFHPPSGATVDSLHTMISGAACQVRYPAPRALERLKQIDTLPRVMQQAGYTPLFFAASRRHLSDDGDSCEAYGYDRFLGCPEAAPRLRSNEWGVNDGDFFQWARGELGNLVQPHFVTFMNLSNHSPYDAPWQEKVKLPDGNQVSENFIGRDREERMRYAGHVRYADEMMGTMAYWLRDRYPDSLFIFVGDHCGNKLRTHNRRIPFILWNDQVIDPKADTSSWFGSQMDIVATLAALVLPEGTTFRTFGHPVWDSSPERISSAGPWILAAKGVVECKQRPDGSATHTSPATARALRCSAIDALSWGFFHDRPLP